MDELEVARQKEWRRELGFLQRGTLCESIWSMAYSRKGGKSDTRLYSAMGQKMHSSGCSMSLPNTDRLKWML